MSPSEHTILTICGSTPVAVAPSRQAGSVGSARAAPLAGSNQHQSPPTPAGESHPARSPPAGGKITLVDAPQRLDPPRVIRRRLQDSAGPRLSCRDTYRRASVFLGRRARPSRCRKSLRNASNARITRAFVSRGSGWAGVVLVAFSRRRELRRADLSWFLSIRHRVAALNITRAQQHQRSRRTEDSRTARERRPELTATPAAFANPQLARRPAGEHRCRRYSDPSPTLER